jgi:DNA-binding IscR family transcriptional regulator
MGSITAASIRSEGRWESRLLSIRRRCPLLTACQLRVALQEALAAFFTVLDRYTLADLIRAPEQLMPLLGLDQQ